jgi:hypothetical protein
VGATGRERERERDILNNKDMELRSSYIVFSNEHKANYTRDFKYQQQENIIITRLLNFKHLTNHTDIISHFITYLNYISILIYIDF